MPRRLAIRAAAMLALWSLASPGQAAEPERLRGAWQLEGYELAGQARESSGILLFEGERFGMVYTMRGADGGLEGRAHAGPVALDGDLIRFGVQWWVEHVDGVARIVPGVSRDTRIQLEGDRLTLHFSNGAIQRLRRLVPPISPQATGVWEVRGLADPGAQPIAASGLLLASAGRFVLVYTEGQGTDAKRGHSATGVVAGDTLRVDRAVSSVDGTGSVLASEGASELTLSRAGASRTLTDRAGRTLSLIR